MSLKKSEEGNSMFKNYSFLPYSIFKEFEMNERPSPSDPMTMGHPCGSMSPIFRSDQGFHSFSLFLHSSPPDRGTEKSGQPSVIRNPNMDMVVCYRKERTHTPVAATSLPYREAASAEIFAACNGVVV